MQMRGLTTRLIDPTVKAVCRNIAFSLSVVPTAIYKWETSCVRGQITITLTIENLEISCKFFIIQGFQTIVFIFIVISTTDEDNSPKTFNDKNYEASSQKFWQLISCKFSNETKLFATIASPHKAPTIRPPASHHENYPS